MNARWQLYDIETRVRSYVETMVDQETGEVSDEMEKGLAALEVERETVIEGVALMIREMYAEADVVKGEGQRLMDRASKMGHQADALKDRLAAFVGVGKKLKTSRISLYWGSSSSLFIQSEKDLPLWALRTSVSVDKIKLKEVLTLGSDEDRKAIEGNVSLRKSHYMAIK